MRRTIVLGIAVTLFSTLMHIPAQADLTVYYHAGNWDAFSGPGEGGAAVCGIGITSPADGRNFSVRVQVGSDNVAFQVKRPSWDIPSGTTIPIVMQVGLGSPWSLQATGAGDIVKWALDGNSIQSFDSQFRRAGSMTLSFPSGNEAPWTIALNGSTAISNTWGRCVSDLSRRGGVAAPPPNPAVPTQPFGQPATQPFSPGPTRP